MRGGGVVEARILHRPGEEGETERDQTSQNRNAEHLREPPTYEET